MGAIGDENILYRMADHFKLKRAAKADARSFPNSTNFARELSNGTPDPDVYGYCRAIALTEVKLGVSPTDTQNLLCVRRKQGRRD
jgi:hypothetical protein